MGIMPEVFYAMEFEDFLLMRRGWNEKLLLDQLLVRKQTFIIAQTLGQKLAALEKAWPNPLNPGKQAKMVTYKGLVMTEHQMKQLVKSRQEAQKLKQEKRNG